MDLQVFVALLRKKDNKFTLQLRLGLVEIRLFFTGSYSVTTVFSVVCAMILKYGTVFSTFLMEVKA